MMKSEKAMGEAFIRVARVSEWWYMNRDEQDKERILRQKGCYSSWISNAGPINVADEEKLKSNISQHKYERWMC